jgi:hypothetical protein
VIIKREEKEEEKEDKIKNTIYSIDNILLNSR